MADPTYDDLILARLIGNPDPEAYARALHEVQPTFFLVGSHRQLYEILSRYFRATGYPIDYTVFRSMLDNSNIEPAMKMLLDSEFARLWHSEVPEAHFRWALREIRTKRRDERFGAAIADALRAMYEGHKGEVGYEVGRKLLTEGLAEIDRHFQPSNPEGDIRLDGTAMIQAYEEAVATEGITERMIRTAIPELDSRITGLRPGENMLVAAYSSHGKTTLIQNIAWSVCVQEAKNVVVFTNENLYDQYRDRIYSRHTHHLPGEVGTPDGLHYQDIKTGKLSGADEQTWRRVVNDFANNPAYGKLIVSQMPFGGNMEWVNTQLARYHEEFDVGLVVLDYVGRMGAITPRERRRDEHNDTLNAWKNSLVSFGNGIGVPGITGWQISREKWVEATDRGYYMLDCLGETSEAERNADIVATLLRQPEVEQELTAQLVKNRDGELMEPTALTARFATTLITGQTTYLR